MLAAETDVQRIEDLITQIRTKVFDGTVLKRDSERLVRALQVIADGDFDRFESGIPLDVFLSPGEQVSIARKRNEESGWGFSDQDFEDLEAGSLREPSGMLTALVLEVHLDTFEETLGEAWRFANHPCDGRSVSELLKEHGTPELIPGIEHQRGLRFRSIDLASHWRSGKSPQEVRCPQISPHTGVLWAASYHQRWVGLMDGKTVPYVWVPGIEIAHDSDLLSFGIGWCGHEKKLAFKYQPISEVSDTWAIPAYVG